MCVVLSSQSVTVDRNRVSSLEFTQTRPTKSTSMQFLNLPAEIVSERILPLLALKWIVRLDSSVSNQAKRQEWLLTLSKVQCFQASLYRIEKIHFPTLKWICDRNIWFSRIIVSNETQVDMIESLLNSAFKWTRITELDIGRILVNSTILRFLEQLSELERLYIATVTNQEATQILMRTATKLKSLRLGPHISECTLKNQSHPNLEELILENGETLLLEDIVAYLAQARKLSKFMGLKNVPDGVLVELSRLPLRQVLPQEGNTASNKEESFSSCLHTVIVLHSQQLTESAFVALAEGCPKLTHLSVFRCTGMTDDSLSAFGMHCPLLEVLHLKQCSDVTDNGIIAVAQGCPLLRSCSLYHNVQITEAGVTALAESCPRLTSLDLSTCVNITDSAVCSIFQYCASLEHLYIDGCPRLTAMCLTQLQDRAANNVLRKIVISADIVSKDVMKLLSRQYPFLRFVG